jgi:tetratricopeptide (TPR) repeat protein
VTAFVDVPDAELATEARAAFDRSLDDFFLAQRSNAERPESHVNLGIVNVKRGRFEEARRSYDTALRLAPWFIPAHVNLADLLRLQGRDDEGEKVLRQALQVDPRNASVRHALGLLLVRTKRGNEALAELGRAAALAPEDPDFAYTYAIGLHSAGRAREAQERSPGARGLLVALVTIHRERGTLREARAWARKLVEAAPRDPSARGLAASLEPADTREAR